VPAILVETEDERWLSSRDDGVTCGGDLSDRRRRLERAHLRRHPEEGVIAPRPVHRLHFQPDILARGGMRARGTGRHRRARQDDVLAGHHLAFAVLVQIERERGRRSARGSVLCREDKVEAIHGGRRSSVAPVQQEVRLEGEEAQGQAPRWARSSQRC
jgi:hypothetical protein